MNAEAIGPFHGGWRLARKAGRCQCSRECQRRIEAGDRYYDTCEGTGLWSPFQTIRVAEPCANAMKESR